MARPRLEEQQKNLSETRKLYTRTQVAKLLGIGSRNTLRTYEWLALFAIEHYRELMRVDGQIKRGRPLCHYQVWCLAKIQKMFEAIPDGSQKYVEVRQFLRENPHLIDAQAYAEEMASLIRKSA